MERDFSAPEPDFSEGDVGSDSERAWTAILMGQLEYAPCMRSGDEMHGRQNPPTRRILVAFFSWSGNTRRLAGQIHKLVGGELFEIVSVDKYPSGYDATVRQAKKELDARYVPGLVSEVDDLESYSMVFIGYPNWWGTIPRPVASFLSRCDSEMKTIAPFCTHEGSRLGRSVEDIASLCKRSTVREGLAVRGGEVGNAQSKVSEWLRRIGMTD